MQLIKIAFFFLLLVLGVHVFRYRPPPDHFAYLDKRPGEEGPDTEFIDHRRENVPVDLNHDIRTTIVVPVNTGISKDFKIPVSSYFYSGLGVPLETAQSGPLHYLIFGEDPAGRPVKLHSEIIEEDRSQWHDTFIDMSSWAGRTIKTTIQCTGANPQSFPHYIEIPYLLYTPRIIARQTRNKSQPNIVLVVIDTLRYDAANPATMPRLHALAERGVRFSRAYSAYCWTGPSTASILTGMMPCQHRVLSFIEMNLAEKNVSIAEVLHKQGNLQSGLRLTS